MIRLLGVLLFCLALTAPAHAANPNNPLAGHELGVNTSSDAGNRIYTSWQNAEGAEKDLLARVGPKSRVRWYGGWSGTGDVITRKIRGYIDNVQAGDPSVVAPMAFFRLWHPNGEGDRDAMTNAERIAYRQWIYAASKGIGDSKVAIVLEPDLPLILPRHGTEDTANRQSLLRYASRILSRLPNTAVYIDIGSADWLSVPEAVDLLLASGVGLTRGFALGATHYDSTESNVEYGRQITLGLRRAGLRAVKRFVIDTADNGRPFTHAKYHELQRTGHRKNHFDNADVCLNLAQPYCNTLGIPPTTDVTNPDWGFTPEVTRYARDYADAFLWFGRPWLKMQADPFCLVRAQQVARTTPYAEALPQLSAAEAREQQATCYRAP